VKNWVDVPLLHWYRPTPSTFTQEVMLWHDFVATCGAPGIFSEAQGTTAVRPMSTSLQELKSLQDVPLLVNTWDIPPGISDLQYGFRPCKRQPLSQPAVGWFVESNISEPRCALTKDKSCNCC
jgi:hypothetical protein